MIFKHVTPVLEKLCRNRRIDWKDTYATVIFLVLVQDKFVFVCYCMATDNPATMGEKKKKKGQSLHRSRHTELSLMSSIDFIYDCVC